MPAPWPPRLRSLDVERTGYSRGREVSKGEDETMVEQVAAMTTLDKLACDAGQEYTNGLPHSPAAPASILST